MRKDGKASILVVEKIDSCDDGDGGSGEGK